MTYAKSKNQEATGVLPLKNKDGFIQSDAQVEPTYWTNS